MTLPEHFRSGGYETYGGGKIFHALSWIRDGYGKQQNESKIWDSYWSQADNPMPEPLAQGFQRKRGDNGYLYSKPIAVGKDLKGRPPHFFDWEQMTNLNLRRLITRSLTGSEATFFTSTQETFFPCCWDIPSAIPWYAPKSTLTFILRIRFSPKVLDGDLDDVPKRDILASVSPGING